MIECEKCTHYRNEDTRDVFFKGCFHPDNIRLLGNYYSNKHENGTVATMAGKEYDYNLNNDCQQFKKKKWYQGSSRSKPKFKGYVPKKPYCSDCKHYTSEPYGMIHVSEVCKACVPEGEDIDPLEWISSFTFKSEAKNPNHPKNRNKDNSCQDYVCKKGRM